MKINWEFIGLTLLFLLFLVSFVKAEKVTVSGWTIETDKNTYHVLQRGEMYVNLTSPITIPNFNLDYISKTAPNGFRVEEIYELKNVTKLYIEKEVNITCVQGPKCVGKENDTFTCDCKSIYNNTDCVCTSSVAEKTVNYSVMEWIPFNGTKYSMNSQEIRQYKILFTVPMKSSGKFNVSFSVAGLEYSLDPWWSSNWDYRRSIIINSTAASTLTNYPAYFVLDTNALITAGKMNTSCQDLRVANETDQLAYFIEPVTCNTTTTVIFTKIAYFLTNNQTIYVYYGNPDAADAQSATNTFSNNFTSVYLHANGTDALGTNLLLNQTANLSQITGFEGGKAYNTTGASPLRENQTTLFNPQTTNMTISGRIKPWGVSWDNPLYYNCILCGEKADSTTPIFTLFYINGSNQLGLVAQIRNDSAHLQTLWSGPNISVNAWNYFAYRWNSNTGGIEIWNGTVWGGGTMPYGPNSVNRWTLYTEHIGAVYQKQARSAMDRIYISPVNRTGDWLQAEYLQFYTVNATEEGNPAPIYSENSTNSTLADTNIKHNLRWANNSATTNMSGYIFGFCNGSSQKLTTVAYTVIYNFTDNVTNDAWWASPANPITVPTIGTEATAEQYSNMSTNNGVFALACSDNGNDDPFWQYNLTINQTKTSINWINVQFTGYEAQTEDGLCYVWNYTGSAWSDLGKLPEPSNGTISKNYTNTAINDIINTNGRLIVMCTGTAFDAGECVFADFVDAQVNYNTTGYVGCACSDAAAEMTNDSWVAFTNAMCQTSFTDCWSNVTKLVNSTVGSTIKWCVSANDTSNLWNYTACSTPFSYLTTTAGGGEAYYVNGDEGDPLFCSIPAMVLDTNVDILCMPKSNITGQPLTGLTVNCQANAQGLYTASIQASSAAGERSGGVYNWTLLGSSISANTCYSINCSTAVETTMNGFAGSFCVMPAFGTSAEVQALTANITSVNTTTIAVGSNLTTANTNILAVGSNLTSHNNTMNAQYGLLAQNLTLIQGNLSAMITAASSAYTNITATNNSLGTFITASYSNFNNITAVNNSLQALMTASYSNFANNTAINNSLGTFITASYSNFNNVTAINNSLQALLTASYSDFANNTAMNYSLTAYYNALANNLTNHNTTMVAEFNAIGTNLTNMNMTIVATNNSLATFYGNLASNLTTLQTEILAVGSNLTSHNNTMNAQYGLLAQNLTLIQGNLSAVNNSLQSLMTASYSNFANTTAINNSLATHITTANSAFANITAMNYSLQSLMTASYSNFANVTALNYSLTAYYNAIGNNLTIIQDGITATNNSMTAYYNNLANNLTSVNNTIIEVGYNVTQLSIAGLAANLTSINNTLVATNNSLQVLMTASSSNFLNNTAMNNSLASFYGKTSQNLTLILGNLSALNIDAIAQNLTDINMTLIATNNSLNAFYNNLATNLTAVNNTIIEVGYNVTSVNNTVIAVGTNLTAYYHALASNLTEFNTTSFALMAELGINITSVNNTIIMVGSNQTMNATRVFNILSAIAGCMPCPIGGLVGGGGSTTVPIPALYPNNASIYLQIPQAPVTNWLAGIAGLLLIICGGMYYKLRGAKKKLKKAKKEKEERPRPPSPAKE